MPKEINGERYLTAIEAASYLGISRDKFYKNVKDRCKQYTLGAWNRPHYKQSELEALREPHLRETPHTPSNDV
jgi:predicted DNA-binding transcriptional regulator AlpA